MVSQQDNHVEIDVAVQGAVYRAARALLGLSQGDVCERAGCGRKLLNDLENGLNTPGEDKLRSIRAALEAFGIVFMNVNGMTMIGARADVAGRRSSRARSFAQQ
jgi:transcriptional regulator with XRE-family HTH domain